MVGEARHSTQAAEKLRQKNEGSLAQKAGSDELDNGLYPQQTRNDVCVARVAQGEGIIAVASKDEAGVESGKAPNAAKRNV